TARHPSRIDLSVSLTGTTPGNTSTTILDALPISTDCAGNVSSCSQTITLHQDAAPSLAKGPIAACYKSLTAADAAAKAATTGTGGCGSALSFSVSDDGNTCPATITVRSEEHTSELQSR